MNTETGEIKNLEAATRSGWKRMTELSREEQIFLSDIDSDQRPIELALRRFVKSRDGLGRKVGVFEKNAFRLGYQAAQKDRG